MILIAAAVVVLVAVRVNPLAPTSTRRGNVTMVSVVGSLYIYYYACEGYVSVDECVVAFLHQGV